MVTKPKMNKTKDTNEGERRTANGERDTDSPSPLTLSPKSEVREKMLKQRPSELRSERGTSGQASFPYVGSGSLFYYLRYKKGNQLWYPYMVTINGNHQSVCCECAGTMKPEVVVVKRSVR